MAGPDKLELGNILTTRSPLIRRALIIFVGIVLLGILVSEYWPDDRPEHDVSEVQSEPRVEEIAPGVFSRQIEYGSTNQTFIVFNEYVVVFDPGEAHEAAGLMQAIRVLTDLPVRYAISSHFHPDHSFGISFFENEGAEAIASASGKTDYEIWARLLFERRRGRQAAGFKGLEYPRFTYIDQPLILDDGNQRMEIRHYGHGHTSADLVAWLPQHGVLLVADVSNNGPIALASSNVSSWIDVLAQLEALPVRIVVPGHGQRGGRELIGKNRRFLTELLAQVSDMVQRGRSYEEVLEEIEVPFHEEWAGMAVDKKPGNVKAVFQQVEERIELEE